MRNRSRLELTATILRVATEGMSSTKIMFNVYVSYQVKRVLGTSHTDWPSRVSKRKANLLNYTKGFRFPTYIYTDERYNITGHYCYCNIGF